MIKNIKYNFSKAKDFGLSELDSELEKDFSDRFNSLKLTQDQVDGILKFYGDQVSSLTEILSGPKTDLKDEQKDLMKMWGKDYDKNLTLVKIFSDTMPRKMMENPIVDTADGIGLLFRLAKEANLTPFRKLN